MWLQYLNLLKICAYCCFITPKRQKTRTDFYFLRWSLSLHPWGHTRSSQPVRSHLSLCGVLLYLLTTFLWALVQAYWNKYGYYWLFSYCLWFGVFVTASASVTKHSYTFLGSGKRAGFPSSLLLSARFVAGGGEGGREIHWGINRISSANTQTTDNF